MSTTVETTADRRVMHLMDESGHTSIGWDPEDDEWVLPMIRRKMAAGTVFWIVKRNPLREVALTRLSDIGENRHVIIKDETARTLFDQGRIGVVADADDQLETTRRARTAEEVVGAETVAHRPLRGG